MYVHIIICMFMYICIVVCYLYIFLILPCQIACKGKCIHASIMPPYACSVSAYT